MTSIDLDLPVEPERLRDRASRLTAVGIALITLVAAAVGMLNGTAVRNSGDADVEAQRLGVDAFGALIEAEAQAQLELEAFAASVEDAAMRWTLVQQAHLEDEADAAILLGEAETWAELAEIDAARTSIVRDPRFGPEGDLAFPRRFLTERSRAAFLLTARQDALVEYGREWGADGGAYTAILAVLAVSVSLLGLSLTASRALARRTFRAVGGVMAVGAAVWALTTAITAPVRAPDAAAEHFATGRVGLLTATSQEEYAAAASEFDAAIRLRDTFGQAYVHRATAVVYASSPQLGGYLSLTSPDAVRQGRDDLRRAMTLGVRTRSVIGNLGFYTYLVALDSGSRTELDEAIRLNREAVELDDTTELTPDDLVMLGNLAVSYLAAGRSDEAATAYDGFIAGLSAPDPVTQARLPVETAVYLASEAMTDLEVVLARDPGLAAVVDALKARMAGAVAQAPADSRSSPTVHATDAEVVFPGGLQFEIEHAGIGATDYLSVYWYRSAGEGAGWHVVPEVSGPLWLLDPQGEVALRGTDDGRYHYLASLVERSSPRRCVDGGDYRAELFVNGRRVEVVEGSADWTQLRPFIFRELGMAMCGPAGWVRMDDREVGHSDGFTSPDGSRGALVMRVPAAGQSLADSLGHALARDGVPAGAEQTDESVPGFLGLTSHLRRDYAYDGGLMIAMAGFVPQENVHLVLVVFGPTEWWTEPPVCQDEDRPAGAACESLNLVDSARPFDFVPSSGEEPTDPGGGDPSFGVVSFGTEIASGNEPGAVIVAAESGTSRLCGFWAYSGMASNTPWAARWYRDGGEVEGGSVVEEAWAGGPAGNWYVCIGDAVTPLEEGEYEFVLELEGEVVRSDALFVGGDHPLVPFELVNEAGVEVCLVRLSPDTAQNWGPDELPDSVTIRDGETYTLSVPAGTYDMSVSDCEGNDVATEFSLQIEGAAPRFVIEAPA